MLLGEIKECCLGREKIYLRENRKFLFVFLRLKVLGQISLLGQIALIVAGNVSVGEGVSDLFGSMFRAVVLLVTIVKELFDGSLFAEEKVR